MKYRSSDLVLESFGEENSAPLHFSSPEESIFSGFKVIRSSLREKEYHSVVSGKLWLKPSGERKRAISLLSSLIEKYSEKNRAEIKKGVLVVGIGNPSVSSDSLGAISASSVMTSAEGMKEYGIPPLRTVCPGTYSSTGIETSRFVSCLAREMKPGLIIAIDALTAKSPERLHGIIQISDSGITPGSALSHVSGEISRETTDTAVISIGVPTVMRSDILSGKEEDDIMFVTRAESDIIIKCYAGIISSAINLTFLGNIFSDVI